MLLTHHLLISATYYTVDEARVCRRPDESVIVIENNGEARPHPDDPIMRRDPVGAPQGSCGENVKLTYRFRGESDREKLQRVETVKAGNSDGDFQMLEWTTAGDGQRLGVLVHHTDAEREWAYDRESHVGRLQRGLDEAAERGWLLIDMKGDWKVIFPPAK